MPNRHRRWAAALSGLAVLLLSSCQLMSGLLSTSDGPTTPPIVGETRSLADIVIDDFIASIQTNTFSRALDASGKLNPSDIATLKATIRNKIASDGLGASKNIDKILPSVMEGISSGVKNLAAMDSDTVVSAQLLSKAMKSTSESLSKNAATLSTPSVVLSDVLKDVVKKGADDLATIAKTDPESAGKAMQAVVREVSAAMKSNSVAISATVVLQTVVTASVQAAVESNNTGLVQAIFTGTAEATTDKNVVGDVVKDAVSKARDGQVGKLMDSDTATDLMKQASAGLNASSLTSTQKVDVDDALLKKTTDALTVSGVEVSSAKLKEIKEVVSEADPVASLSVSIDGTPYAEGEELPHSTTARAVTLVLPTETTTTKQLIGPDGNDITGTNYTLTGSGAFRFILLVKNTTGVKSAFKTLVIRVKSLPAEVAPTAIVTVKEGTTPVTGPLVWTKAGHTLTFDTAGTTANTTIKILSDSPAAFPTKNAESDWSAVQRSGTVNYSMIVRNIGGTKTAVETVTVTVDPEPKPIAALGVFNGTATVTAPLPKKDFYDLILRAEGSTTGDVAYEVVATPSAQVIKTAEGVWSTKIFTDTTFTLTVKNLGGQNSATATKTVTIAPEAAPVAVLTIKKDGVAVTNLDFSATGYDLVLDPAGSTTENTQLTLEDGGNNTVLVKDVDAGTWTAKAVQKPTTFTLTVKNLGGSKSSTATATITIAPPATSTDVSTDVASGREYLRQHNWSAAKTAFAGALLKNPSDQDAKIWSAFLDLITLSVHPQLVDLMKNRVGAVDYPSDMETLTTRSWMKASAYTYGNGFTKVTTWRDNDWYFVRGDVKKNTDPEAPDSNGYGYRADGNPHYNSLSWSGSGTNGYHFVPSAAGEYMISDWYSSDEKLKLDVDVYGKAHVADGTIYRDNHNILDGTAISPLPQLKYTAGFERMEWQTDGAPSETNFGAGDYSRLLGANVFTRNPMGFTGVVEQVLSGPFGAGFDSILSRLTSIDDAFRTEVPANLISQVTDAANAPALPIVVSLGKPELLLLAAQLKATKSFVLYLGSVSFDYPIVQTFVDLVSQVYGVDANGDKEDDRLAVMYQSTPGMYSSGLFKDRNNGRRDASKATFLAALADAKSALTLYKTLVADSTSYYRAQISKQISDTTQVDGYVKTADQVLANLILQNTTVAAAIDANTSLTVNSALYNGTVVSSMLAPLTGDLPSGQTIVVNPGAVWANNILDPRFWFETDANGFSIYVRGQNGSSWTNPPADYIRDNDFLVRLPADRSLITPATYNLASTASTGAYSRYMWVSPVFKVKVSSLNAFYPAANPNDQQLTASFGPGWELIDSTWDNATFKTKYIYTLRPPVEVENYLSWVNKK